MSMFVSNYQRAFGTAPYAGWSGHQQYQASKYSQQEYFPVHLYYDGVSQVHIDHITVEFEEKLRLHDHSASYHSHTYSHYAAYPHSACPTSPYSGASDSKDSTMDDESYCLSTSFNTSYPSLPTSKSPRRRARRNDRAAGSPDLGEFHNEGEAGPIRAGIRSVTTQMRRASGSQSPYDKDDRNVRKKKVSSRSVKSEKKLTALARQKRTLQTEMRHLEEQLHRPKEVKMAVDESPARPTPSPAHSTPSPAHSTPSPAHSTPSPSRSTPLKIKCPGGKSVGFLTLQLGNYSLGGSLDDDDEEMQDDEELVRLVAYPASDEDDSGCESPVYERRRVFRVGRS